MIGQGFRTGDRCTIDNRTLRILYWGSWLLISTAENIRSFSCVIKSCEYPHHYQQQNTARTSLLTVPDAVQSPEYGVKKWKEKEEKVDTARGRKFVDELVPVSFHVVPDELLEMIVLVLRDEVLLVVRGLEHQIRDVHDAHYSAAGAASESVCE